MPHLQREGTVTRERGQCFPEGPAESTRGTVTRERGQCFPEGPAESTRGTCTVYKILFMVCICNIHVQYTHCTCMQWPALAHLALGGGPGSSVRTQQALYTLSQPTHVHEQSCA